MRPSSSPPRPPTRTQTLPRRRIFAFGGLLGLWILLILGRLYGLQVIDYVKWVTIKRRQQQHTMPLPAERGTIYDRRGRELAIAVPAESVGASPHEIQDPGLTAKLLAPVLGADVSELEDRLEDSHSFLWLARGLPDELADRVRSLGLKGISLQTEMRRSYPRGSLAASVVGYAGLDDQGLGGLESGFNKLMAGHPGRVLMNEDAHGHVFQSSEWKGQAGANVVLTLDADLQGIVQATLDQAVKDHHAAGALGIVEEPSTGKILAMVSEPTFDPNHFDESRPENRINRTIQWVYEPGSMFKLVTYSGALEEGLISPEEMIDCQMGSITIGHHVIHDDERFGVMTVEEALAHSSDVAAIKIGLRLGQDRLYQYIRRYGFGSRTGIELPGEEQGLLKPPERWSGISIGAVSIGQEVGVTGLQVVSAYSAIANGGVYMPPRIIDHFEQDSAVTSPLLRPSRRVVSERTAQLMKHMLMEVVEEGSGRNAQLRGYSAAGKTGTAQKIDPSGAYSHSHFVASFVGMAPVERPAVVVLVSVDSPVGEYYGAEVAAPIFKNIMEQILTRLNVPEDRPAPLIVKKAKPGKPVEADPPPAEISDAVPSDGLAPNLTPVALTNDDAGPATVVLENGPLVTVPDFTGLAQRPVADQCQALGLDLVVGGSGLAAEQFPAAGSKVPARTKLRVRFAR
ncbi:MAG TPA: penicillin-binding protein [Terriglobia bacterium]